MKKLHLLVLFVALMAACSPAPTPPPAIEVEVSPDVVAWVPEGNQIVKIKNPVPPTPGNDYLTDGVQRTANFQEFEYVDGGSAVLEDGCEYSIISKGGDWYYVDLDSGVCPGTAKVIVHNGGFWLGEVDAMAGIDREFVEALITATPRNAFGYIVWENSDAEANYQYVRNEAEFLGWNEYTNAFSLVLYVNEQGEIIKLCYYTMNESWLSTEQMEGMFFQAFPNYNSDGGKKDHDGMIKFLELLATHPQ